MTVSLYRKNIYEKRGELKGNEKKNLVKPPKKFCNIRQKLVVKEDSDNNDNEKLTLAASHIFTVLSNEDVAKIVEFG